MMYHLTNVVWLFPRLTESFIAFPLVELERRNYPIQIFAMKDTRRALAKEDVLPEQHVHQQLQSSQLLAHVVYTATKETLYHALFSARSQTDVVIFHWSDYVSWLLSWPPLPHPVLLCCHEPDFSSAFLPAFQQHAKEILCRVTMVTVETPDQRQRLLNSGFPSDRVVVWQAGIDIRTIDETIGSRSQEMHMPVLISSACRFVPKKGLLQSIDAMYILHRHGYRFRYSISGDGVLLPLMQERIRQHGLAHLVSITGKQRHPDLYVTFANADILLAPSLSTEDDQEGVVSTILEAMACRLPVVSTPHGGSNIIEHQQTGLLVPENNPEAIASAIASLIQSPGLWRRIQRQAASTVQRHDLQLSVDQLERIVRRIALGSPRHATREGV